MKPLVWKLILPPSHFGFLIPLSPQVKKGVMELIHVNVPHLLLPSGGEKGYVWNTRDLSGWPMIKVNGKLQQSNLGRTNNDLDP